jgi:Holliday junction resolvasome RuvABC DNA-binding subunit
MAGLSLDKPEEEREPLHLYIHPHVYGDNTMTFVYYGFETKEELRVFRDIIRVERVGPSLAFRFMGLPLNILLPAIADRDVKTLTQIKGVGAKVAEKIIDKLGGKSYIPEVTNGKNIDDEKIERLVGSIHELWGHPVTKVRQWLLDQALDYSLPFQELFTKVSKLLMANKGLT